MNTTPWLLIATLTALIILGFVALLVAVRRKEKRPPDYYALFIMGIIWLATGLIMYPMENSLINGLFILGLIFIIVGLVNKDKWKENRFHWGDLSKNERTLRMGLIILLGLLVLAGLVVYLITERGGI